MERKKINLIGLSGKTSSGREDVSKALTELYPEWKIKRIDFLPRQIVSFATGIPVDMLDQDEIRKSYLGDNWSYIREERFVGNGVIERKPVRYYLTPQAMLQKVNLEIVKQIHVNFWINSLFMSFKETENWIIEDVQYPNEAEMIRENHGLLIRVTKKDESREKGAAETALDRWDFDATISADLNPSKLKEQIKQLLSK